MKNQLDLKFEIFKQLYVLWKQDERTIRQIGLDAGIKHFTMHQMVSGRPVCWRHYFKLLSHYGYDIEVKLVKKN